MGFRDSDTIIEPIDDGGAFDSGEGSTSSTSESAANALQAANSAAAALVSENNAAADVVLTNADVVLTHADVVLTNADLALTNADVVLTNADVVLAEADKVQTGLDRAAVAADLVLTNQDTIDTAANLVLTNADVVLTHADVVLAEADKVQTGLDRIATNADVVLTHADVVLTNADVVLAEADKVQTGLDRIATNADVVSTNADVVSTNADVLLADADRVQTGLDRVATAADVVSTNADVVLTNADVVSAGNSVTAAALSATASATAKTAAETAKTAAETAKTAAETAETNAETAETNAETAETNAAGSATASSNSATSAATSASTATTKASEASTSETNALASKNAAAISETNASNSATASANSASSAATSETNAATSASTASSQASTATTKASEASTSATSAATSASTATTKASEASASATGAATSASNSASSATAAQTAETNAETAETNAAASATTATTKAGESLTSANSSASSATTAEAAKDAALAALDSFDDRYLGAKSSDPTVDNDGNALISGALYYNTTDDAMKVYTGSAWVAAYASLAGTLLIANNLNDLDNAVSARSNLGLVIGTNVQAFSAILAATTASYTTALNTKLSGVETGATADQTGAEIKTAYQAEANAFTDSLYTKLDNIEASADVTDTANVVSSLTAGSNITIAADGTISGSAAYSLPTSSATVLGGVKVGTNLSISGTGVLSSANTTYTVGDGGLTQRNFTTTLKDKLDGVAAGATNTIGNATHTGEVTGSGALTISDNVVDEANLKVSNSPTNGYFLSAQSGNSGGLTWATVPAGYDDADVASYLASASSVGIGTSSPATKLHIAGSSSVRNTIVSNVTLDGGVSVVNPYDGFGFGIDFIGRDYGNAVRNYAGIYTEMESQSSSAGGGDAGFTTGLSFYTNAGGASNTDPVERMRISSAGSVGIGITPESWVTGYGGRVLQIGDAAVFGGSTNDSMSYMLANAYYDSVNSRWEYINTDFATRYEQLDGEHIFYTAASGTANAAITWSQAMTLDASSRVGIGTASIDNMVNIQESALAGRGASNGNTSLTLEHATDTGIQFFSATQTQLRFGDAASTGAGSIIYEHGTDKLRLSASGLITFEGNGAEIMSIDASGNLTTNGTTFKSNSNVPRNFKLQPSATSTDVGLSHFAGNGSHGYNLYADGTNYGFLDANWGSWDLKKVKNGALYVDEGSGQNRVFTDAYHPNADKWTTARTLTLSGDVTGSVSWDGTANASISASLTASPSVTNLNVATSIIHTGDTDTGINFDTDQISIAVGGSTELYVNTTGVRLGDSGNGYFQPVSGNYGSIQIDGGNHGGWEGYSIGGRTLFMHDNSSTTGIYNDVNNEWLIRCVHNGSTFLYNNGSEKFQTTTSGAQVNGDLAVTGTVDGRDIATDGTKLDGIEASADVTDTTNVTAAGALMTTGGTLTGDLTIPSKIIHSGDTDTYIRFNSDEFSIYAGGTERVKINNTYAYFNNYVTAPYFSATSDINLKTDIKKIVNPLEMISNLNGYTFNWKESGEASAGVIAQEVEKVLPSAISENKEGSKSVNYNELIGVLIEAVKEQQVQIDSLKKMLGDN